MPRQQSINTRLRARWVEQAALSLKTKLLPGISTYEAIARRIGEVGRMVASGEKPDPNKTGCPLPPDGLEFPKVSTSITGGGCSNAAIKAALKRLPQPEAKRATGRSTPRAAKTSLSWMRARVVQGHPNAVQAYVRVLAHMAAINGYSAPSKVEVIGRVMVRRC